MVYRSRYYKGYKNVKKFSKISTWGVQIVRSPNFFSRGMEADRNVKVVGGDVAVL